VRGCVVKRSLFCLVALGCLSGAGAAGDAGAPETLKKLQGVWRPVRLERAGQTVRNEALPGARFVVKGDTLRFKAGGDTLLDVRFTLDPRKTPARIDLVSRAGPTRGETVRGIYRLEGKRLTLCWPLGVGGERPGNFETKGDRDRVVLTLERE
jgi:uncharacterized protein (TIGR03067 family)